MKEKEINLSYVITTYNKLPYLRIVLSSVIKNIKEDEEIVVTDGASTDGTPEYLKKLFEEGKIHQYVSEKDFGQAHGQNKAWLMAKGKLLKTITDDDAFYFPGIQKCKEFMLAHPKIDALGTEGLLSKAIHESAFMGSKSYSKDYYNLSESLEGNYNEWREKGKPFSFCDLGWMFRRSSISIFGLCDPTFTRVDAEFAIRMSAGKANIAWYTGKNWIRILNPNSVSVTMEKKVKEDTKKLNLIYPGSNLEENHKFTFHDLIPESTKPFLRELRKKIKSGNDNIKKAYIPNDKDWENVFKLREEHLIEVNGKETGKFLYKQ